MDLYEVREYWRNKVAVVTGGARGQGAAITRQLLQAGAHVHVVDCLPVAHEDWVDLKTDSVHLDGELTIHEMDVRDDAAWNALQQHLSRSGTVVMGVVNNAGITGARSTVTKTDLIEWNHVLDINLTGAFLGIKYLAPLMRAGGAIVSISSTVGMTGYHSAAYSTSKWALRGLTKSAAIELASAGIRVNCICPGIVDTHMIRSNDKLFEALKGITPIGKMAHPDQIADVMFFLLGPQSSYITGADLAVDGGVTSGGIFWPIGKAVGAIQ